MAIALADIKKLRDMTSAGMMDCKNALTEAEGDFKRAVEILREKGKSTLSKRGDNETTQGAVLSRVEGGKAILICLGCETDFVAATPDFKKLAGEIADAAIAKFPADAEALKAEKLSDGYTVEEDITNQAGKTGEKHVLAYYGSLEAPFVSEYVHFNGKLGAIVAFNKEVPASIARGIAMQVTSMNPVAVDAASVPAEVIESERTVAIQKTRDEQVQKAVDAALKKAGINPAHVDSEDHIESNTAKGWLTAEQAQQAREIIAKVGAEKAANLPEQMIQNIANGRIQKFLKENTLEEQEYQLSDNKETVKAALAAVDKEAKVLSFKRFSLSD
ncbi:MAG: elongation factor Ts [Bacteroidales bacterium]|nr:elongation factor Ts [Bacteroidales bacterium]MBQ2550129.1 elongation factor Ts [Bacteroidales bacterium]MBQ3917416.1 elongation factor Ts [Bacteroidales bacterium]